MIKNQILEIARNEAMVYKQSKDQNHSDSYSFNEKSIINFVDKLSSLRNLDIESAFIHLNDIESTHGRNGPTIALRSIIERLR